MGSILKHQKLCEEHNDKHCEDRISNLPSSLISHILSLLPTKEAVATSVLSTRWKKLWTLITSLDFDDRLLVKHGKSSLRTSFAFFVNRVLLLHKVSCLHKFRLHCCRSYDVSLVNAWVAASLMCGLQELDLHIPMECSTDHVLPRDLFSCRTLVVLKLGIKFVMHVPALVSMPSLKVLHLHGVKLSDDDSVYRLLHGCPVLEELRLRGCIGEDVHAIYICAPALTKLFIEPLAYDENLTFEYNPNTDVFKYNPTFEYNPNTDVFKYKIVLDTPSLQHLGLEDCVGLVEGYVVKNLCNLIKADIDNRGSLGLLSKQTISKAVTDLLKGISDVQILHLNGGFMVDLYNCDYPLPMFHNLTSLELDWCFYPSWDSMLRFLKKSPHLETLVFSNGYEEGELLWNPPKNEPTCLLLHLKVIEIWGFEGGEEELKMVEYFLKNAEVLERLILHYQNLEVEESEVSKKLLRLPRCSRICQVEMI